MAVASMYRSGWTLEAITAELGIPPGTVKPWLQEAGVRREGKRPSVTVAELEAARRIAV